MYRLFLWFKIRSLEITADNRTKLLCLVADEAKRVDMKIMQANLLAEITALKAEYRRLVRGNGIKAWSAQ
jgi:hypothetical protein